MTEQWWYCSAPFATFLARTRRVGDKKVVVETAPIAHRFIGQGIDNLTRWMQSKGGTVSAL